MKRLLLSFAMLLAMIGTVAAETKTPIELKGGHQDNFTLEEACDVEPLAGSTMDKLFGATFTPKNDFTNLFQYKPLEVGDYEKIIVKFGEPAPSGYKINYNAGYFDLGGMTEYEIVLDGTDISDFTIFNWSGTYAPITITEVYFWTSKTMVEKPKGKGKWISLISNGTADEGDDVLSFPVSKNGPNNGGTANDHPEIAVGEGVDGTNCFKVVSDDAATETWSTQFYLLSKEELPAGTKIRVKFDVKADRVQEIAGSIQGKPRAWHGGLSELSTTVDTDWSTIEFEHTITADDAKANGDGDCAAFLSIAVDLNMDKEAANTFYFDNIVLEKYVPSIGVDFGNSAAQIVFPYPTNITSLVEAGGKNRLTLPKETATLTVNGTAVGVDFVEYDLNGSVYVFPAEEVVMESSDKVEVKFTNPASEDFHIVYTEDAHKDEAIETIDVEAEWNEKVSEVMPFSYGEPVLESVDPENGSFNLPNTISEFTLTFDKPVDCAKLTAKIDNVKLTNTPAEGMSKVVKLTRTGDALPTGTIKINVTNVWGEYTWEDFVKDNDFDLTYGIGVTTLDGDDQPAVIYASNFKNEGDDANGAGWMLNADNGGLQPASSGSGCNIRHNQAGFAADLMYLCTRGSSLGVGLYGTEEDHKLALEAKNYHLTLDACQWDKDDARKLRVQVLPEAAVNPEDGTLIDETAIIADEEKDITPKMASKEYVHFDITVAVKEAGNYVIRLLPTNNGTTGGWNDGSAIGNIKVEYVPNAAGVVQVRSLLAAMEQAKAALENAEDEKYRGAAYDALDAKIKEYDGKETVMTAPSAFDNAVRELNAAAKAMNAHVTLCNDYYTLATKAYDLSLSKVKFAATEEYQNVKAAADKFCVVEGEGEEAEMTVIEKTDDAELTAAKEELTTATTAAEKILTEGKSNNNQTSGYAALHERIRRGVALLETLGVDEEDPLIVAANAEYGDNDEIAAAIMQRVNMEICRDLMSEDSHLFESVEDGNGDEVTPSYDLSVFIKNPNAYGPAGSKYAPGWTSTMGDVVAWNSWTGGQSHNDALPPYAEDCSLHAGWHPNGEKGAIVEQTIEGLIPGIYSVKLQMYENGEKRADESESLIDYSFGFAKVTDTLSPEVDEETGAPLEDFDPELHTAGYTISTDDLITDIEVLDGKLTIGYHYGKKSQAFLEDAWIFLTAPVDGHDYAADYATDIDAAKTAKVRAIELYDLNGHRLSKAGKGLTIVKKMMSDGTVKTSKVVK